MLFQGCNTIYYTETITDKRGASWYYINGDTGYRLDQWSKEDAEKDYLSEKSQMERAIETARAWGAYD